MINAILQKHAATHPERIAIQATTGETISYAALLHHINGFSVYLSHTDKTLSRVAVVIPNNFLLSQYIIAAMCHVVVAPMNHRLTQAEFVQYFQALQIDALIVHDKALVEMAVAAAQLLEIPVIVVNAAHTEVNHARLVPESTRSTGLLLSTSGTTSTPKTVFFSTDKIAASAQIIAMTLKLGSTDIGFNVMPVFHIHGLMTGLLAPLVAGGRVLLFNQWHVADFLPSFDQHTPTWMTGTPSIYHSIVNRAKYCDYTSQNKNLRFIRSSSESLPPVLQQDLENLFSAPVIQVYGLTEASHPVSVQKHDGSSLPSSVGFPVQTHVRIVNDEILVRGEGVIVAYENNEQTNQTDFYQGWFRTGDTGYLSDDGELFITGRIKETINKAGEKISPYEIENIIQQHPAVNEVACFPIKDAHVGEKIGTAIVLNPGCIANNSDIQQHTALYLADYKIPDRIIFIDAIPKSDHGKLQRHTLADLLAAYLQPIVHHDVTNTTDVLPQLLAIAETVFKLPTITSENSFFDLGGDSIVGIQLIARINAAFQTNLSIHALYESPTFPALASLIAKGTSSDQLLSMPPVKPQKTLPEKSVLSSMQTSVWFISHLPDTQSLYHMIWTYRLQGPLSIEALQWSINQIIQRHEPLRTRINSIDGKPYQYITDIQIALNVVPFASEDHLQQTIESLIKTPFNFRGGLFFQPYLFEFAQQDHVLCFHLHHIVADLWSKQVLQKELSFYYHAYHQAEKPSLAPIPISYRDYIDGLHKWQTDAWLHQEITFWKTYLQDAPPLLALPTDYPRPLETNYACGVEYIELPEAQVHQLQQFANTHHMSLYMVLLTGFKVLLQHYTGEQKMVIGTPVANRLTPTLEDMMGFFANTLVLATHLPETTSWLEAFQRVKASTLDAFQHVLCPFETLVKAINPARNLNFHPIFQVMFNVVNVPQHALQLPDLVCTEIPMTHLMSTFDLHFSLRPLAGGKMACALYYNQSLFKPETIQRWTKHYQRILSRAMDTLTTPIGACDFLLDEEKEVLLHQWTATNTPYPDDTTTIEQLERVAAAYPHDIALLCGDQTVTYAELNAKANAVANLLLSHGTQPNDLVAIFIERSVDMVAGLLGIWKSGAGYVPLNLNDPKYRLAHILDETDCQFILTKQRYTATITAMGFSEKMVFMDSVASPKNHVHPHVHSTNIAYALYTSGSSGKPKGVVVEHRSLWEYLWAAQHWAHLEIGHRFLQLTPYTFDASLFDLYLPLISRVTVVLPEIDNNHDLAYLADLMVDKKINYIKSVPSFLRLLSNELKTKQHHSLQTIYSVGEELLLTDVQRFYRNTGARLFNQYGPTESIGIVSAAYCAPHDAFVTLGDPIANIRLYVLNKQQQPVPLGCYGELYIAKRYLAKGYLKQTALTSERFIPNPFLTPEEKAAGHYLRLYKSGDNVRWLPDGRLQFAGRIDFQIKMNGQRVEPGEIEAILASHHAVSTVAVIKVSGQLTAFIVLNNAIDNNTLRTYALEYLPAFMIPMHWVIVKALPVTTSGKVDRAALPALMHANKHPKTNMASDSSDAIILPADFAYLPDYITNLLTQVLSSSEVQWIEPHKNFFDLNIDSLRLIEFSQRLKQQLHVNITLHDLFRYQTLSTLTYYIFTLFCENKSILFEATPESFLIPLRKEGANSPLFIIPGGAGEANEMLPFMLMSSHCHLNRPIYGIRSRAMDPAWKLPKTLQEQAHAIFNEIKKIQPHGPYSFLGECIASAMVLELANIAEQQGHPPCIITLLDHCPTFRETFPFSRYVNQFSPRRLAQLKKMWRYWRLQQPDNLKNYYYLLTAWKPKRLESQLHVVFSTSVKKPHQMLKRWQLFFKQKSHLHLVSGNHETYIRQQAIETAKVIQAIFL